jgi:hypothetical protein
VNVARARQRKKEEAVKAIEPAPEPLFEDAPEIQVAPEPEEVGVVETGLFDQIPQAAPAPGIVDADLTEEERTEFANLLRKEVTLEERAKLLGRFARMKDTKRAAVGLRAVQEINRLTGVGADRPVDTMPMFVLAGDQKIAVVVEKVGK